jgi:hypothetical protein
MEWRCCEENQHILGSLEVAQEAACQEEASEKLSQLYSANAANQRTAFGS